MGQGVAQADHERVLAEEASRGAEDLGERCAVARLDPAVEHVVQALIGQGGHDPVALARGGGDVDVADARLGEVAHRMADQRLVGHRGERHGPRGCTAGCARGAIGDDDRFREHHPL